MTIPKTIKVQFSPQNIDTDICVNQIGNRYDLVLVASVRVRELRQGRTKQVSGTNSATITALKEIEAGKIGKEYLKKVR
jgi:DNA-directed RNA polymerase subunit omega